MHTSAKENTLIKFRTMREGAEDGLAGALHAIGRRGEGPVPPLNLVGDFGGGGMLLAYGLDEELEN